LVQLHAVQVPIDEEGATSVGFFGVKRAEGSTINGEQLARYIEAAQQGEFGEITCARLMEGPSYIELGGWIGDQGVALQLIGLGAILGLWDVVLPQSLGITDPETIQDMLGRGYVMVDPIKGSMIEQLAV
jgi:hypothetical protein